MEKKFLHPKPVIIFFVILVSLLMPILIWAEEPFQPNVNPELQVPRMQGQIKIDGELNEPGWKSAARAANFCEHYPGDQTKPPVMSEAFIAYDDAHLYVAFISQEDPSKIRASLMERDRMFNDDNIVFCIDTYGDAAWAYEFCVNALGVQGDLLWSRNGGEDDRYDLVWESMGKITDSGYQVELAIPFTSLRFPNQDEQIWRADFWRNHSSDVRRQYSWAKYSRDESCWPCQWGTLKGIRGVRPGQGLELLPSLIGSQAGALENAADPTSKWKNDDINGTASLGAKYAITSNLTAEATVNPDFSQVESDAAQIEVNTTFALQYEEKRPFFQEGSDLYLTYFNAVYTRSINDPLFATKLVGRMDRTSIYYLLARDEHTPVVIPFEERNSFASVGKSTSNIMRVRQTFGEQSHIGLLVTDRRYDIGGSGSLLSLDAAIQLPRNYQFYTQIVGTYTKEPNDTSLTSQINDFIFDRGRYTGGFNSESYWAHGFLAGFLRSGRHWSFDLSYVEKSPTFRTANGFATSNNSRSGELQMTWELYPKSSFIASITPSIDLVRKWNFSKARKDEWISVDLPFRLKMQTYISFSYMLSRERFREIYFPGIRSFTVHIESQFSNPVGVGLSFTAGHRIARNVNPLPVMGDQIDLEIWAEIKPFNGFIISPHLDYARSDTLGTKHGLFKGNGNIFDGFTYRTRFDYQITRELSIRLITQYDDFGKSFEIDPLVTYKLNPFTLFYFGSTHDFRDYGGYKEINLKQADRQFFLKFQYLLQI